MKNRLTFRWALTPLLLVLWLFGATNGYAVPGPASWSIDNYEVYIGVPVSDGRRNLLFVSVKNFIPIVVDDGLSIPVIANKSPNFMLVSNADGSFSIVEQGERIQVDLTRWARYSPVVIHADFNNDKNDDLYLQSMSDIGADIVFSSNAARLSDALFRVTRIGSDPTETDDAMIRGQWSTFLRALATNSPDGVLNTFNPESRSKYSPMINRFSSDLASFSSSVGVFERMRIDENHAVYVVTRVVGAESIAYFVTFVRATNKSWYISEI